MTKITKLPRYVSADRQDHNAGFRVGGSRRWGGAALLIAGLALVPAGCGDPSTGSSAFSDETAVAGSSNTASKGAAGSAETSNHDAMDHATVNRVTGTQP